VFNEESDVFIEAYDSLVFDACSGIYHQALQITELLGVKAIGFCMITGEIQRTASLYLRISLVFHCCLS
jgi:hypothetical protein